MQTESGVRNKRQLVLNVFKNNFNEKFEKTLRPYLYKSCRIVYCFLKDRLITSETCRTSWTPCSSVLNASHANAPTHRITLNTDTQLYGVIPIYKPPRKTTSPVSCLFLSIYKQLQVYFCLEEGVSEVIGGTVGVLSSSSLTLICTRYLNRATGAK